MWLPQVEAGQIPGKQQSIHPENAGVDDPGTETEIEKPLHDSRQKGAQSQVEQIVEGMGAESGDGRQHLGRMMDLMELPEQRDSVLKPVADVEGQVHRHHERNGEGRHGQRPRLPCRWRAEGAGDGGSDGRRGHDRTQNKAQERRVHIEEPVVQERRAMGVNGLRNQVRQAGFEPQQASPALPIEMESDGHGCGRQQVEPIDAVRRLRRKEQRLDGAPEQTIDNVVHRGQSGSHSNRPQEACAVGPFLRPQEPSYLGSSFRGAGPSANPE